MQVAVAATAHPPHAEAVALIQEFVQLFSDADDVVLDPFAGSGTTLIAAHSLGRRASVYENDPTIFHMACKRIVRAIRDHARRLRGSL